MKSFIIITLCLFCTMVFSQDKDSLLLLNGKSYVGDITGTALVKGDSVVNINVMNKKGKVIPHSIETRRIFSKTENGINKTIYMPNEFMGDYLSISETHDVTIGSYDARQTFKPHWAFWTSFAAGLGASIFDTYLSEKNANDSSLVAPKKPGFFRGDPSIFPFFIPVVASVSWSLPSFKLRDNRMIHKNYKGNEFYYRGYHRIARQRRMLGALLGSFSGIAVGLISYYIIH